MRRYPPATGWFSEHDTSYDVLELWGKSFSSSGSSGRPVGKMLAKSDCQHLKLCSYFPCPATSLVHRKISSWNWVRACHLQLKKHEDPRNFLVHAFDKSFPAKAPWLLSGHPSSTSHQEKNQPDHPTRAKFWWWLSRTLFSLVPFTTHGLWE